MINFVVVVVGQGLNIEPCVSKYCYLQPVSQLYEYGFMRCVMPHARRVLGFLGAGVTGGL